MDIDGTLTTVAEGRYAVRFVRRLAHPMPKVWRAFTDPAELAHWFPGEIAIADAIGGAVRWRFPEFDLTLPQGRVTAYDPPRLLEYTVSSEGMPFAGTGEDRTLRFELSPDGDGCVLTFTNTFGDLPSAASFATGWELCLEALAAVLDGTEAPGGPEFAERHEKYVRRFGLADGTVGADGDGWAVRFERQLTKPVDEVWAALSGANGSVPTPGDPAPAGTTNAFVSGGVLTAVEAPALLEYDARAGDERAGRVRWELSPAPAAPA